MSRRAGRWLTAAVAVAISVGVSGCGGTSATERRPMSRARAIGVIDGACRRFLAGDAELAPNPATVEELRDFAAARLRLAEAARATLDSAAFPETMSRQHRKAAQLLDESIALYRLQVDDADLDELRAYHGQSEDLIRQLAVMLFAAGAHDCIPVTRPKPAAPVAGDAGELIPAQPSATISVGQPGVDPNRIVAGPDAVWVGLKNTREMVRIDPDSNEVVARIPLEGAPSGLPQLVAGRIWIDTPEEVLRIDPIANRVDRRLVRGELGYGEDSPVVITATALYTCTSGVLHVVSPIDGASIRSVSVPAGCTDVSTDGRMFWVRTDSRRTLARIDPNTGATLARFESPEALMPPLFDGDSMWTGDENGVQRLDTATGEVLGSAARTGLRVLEPDIGGGAYWTTSAEQRRVVRVDGRTLQTQEIVAGDGVNAVAVGDDALWVTNSDAATVMRFPLGDLGP